MKKGIIVNLRHIGFLNYVKQNKIFLIFATIFILGIIIGSIILSNDSYITQLSKTIFNNIINLHTQKSFFKKFLTCYFHYTAVLLLYYLSGTSMVGIAITPFLTIWQGILIGNIISYIYTSHGITGIAFNAIVLIPPITVFLICVFFAAKHSTEFSLSIAKLILPKNRPTNLCNTFKKFCIKYLILFAFMVVCSLIEILLNTLFLKYFNI